jgi:hypothetical protein
MICLMVLFPGCIGRNHTYLRDGTGRDGRVGGCSYCGWHSASRPGQEGNYPADFLNLFHPTCSPDMASALRTITDSCRKMLRTPAATCNVRPEGHCPHWAIYPGCHLSPGSTWSNLIVMCWLALSRPHPWAVPLEGRLPQHWP